jgi:hypothetical protein
MSPTSDLHATVVAINWIIRHIWSACGLNISRTNECHISITLDNYVGLVYGVEVFTIALFRCKRHIFINCKVLLTSYVKHKNNYYAMSRTDYKSTSLAPKLSPEGWTETRCSHIEQDPISNENPSNPSIQNHRLTIQNKNG